MTTTVSACCGAEVETRYSSFIDGNQYTCTKCRLVNCDVVERHTPTNPPTETVSDCCGAGFHTESNAGIDNDTVDKICNKCGNPCLTIVSPPTEPRETVSECHKAKMYPNGQCMSCADHCVGICTGCQERVTVENGKPIGNNGAVHVCSNPPREPREIVSEFYKKNIKDSFLELCLYGLLAILLVKLFGR